MSKNHDKKYFPIFFLSFLLIIVIVLISIIRREFIKSVWDGKERISLVVVSDPLSLISLDSVNNSLNILVFPKNLYANVPGGYGPYKLTSVWQLSILEKKEEFLLSKTITSLLGIPIDGYLAPPKNNWDLFGKIKNREDINSLQKDISTLENNLNISNEGKIKTNLSFIDIFRLWNSLGKLRIDKVNFIDLGKINITKKIILPDNTSVSKLDTAMFDNSFSDLLADGNIKKENLSVSIKNAAKISGLGSAFGRIINNIGGHVINIDNNDLLQKYTLCVFNNTVKNTFTVKKIIRFTGCQTKVNMENNNEADITVILGQDSIPLLQ